MPSSPEARALASQIDLLFSNAMASGAASDAADAAAAASSSSAAPARSPFAAFDFGLPDVGASSSMVVSTETDDGPTLLSPFTLSAATFDTPDGEMMRQVVSDTPSPPSIMQRALPPHMLGGGLGLGFIGAGEDLPGAPVARPVASASDTPPTVPRAPHLNGDSVPRFPTPIDIPSPVDVIPRSTSDNSVNGDGVELVSLAGFPSPPGSATAFGFTSPSPPPIRPAVHPLREAEASAAKVAAVPIPPIAAAPRQRSKSFLGVRMSRSKSRETLTAPPSPVGSRPVSPALPSPCGFEERRALRTSVSSHNIVGEPRRRSLFTRLPRKLSTRSLHADANPIPASPILPSMPTNLPPRPASSRASSTSAVYRPPVHLDLGPLDLLLGANASRFTASSTMLDVNGSSSPYDVLTRMRTEGGMPGSPTVSDFGSSRFGATTQSAPTSPRSPHHAPPPSPQLPTFNRSPSNAFFPRRPSTSGESRPTTPVLGAARKMSDNRLPAMTKPKRMEDVDVAQPATPSTPALVVRPPSQLPLPRSPPIVVDAVEVKPAREIIVEEDKVVEEAVSLPSPTVGSIRSPTPDVVIEAAPSVHSSPRSIRSFNSAISSSSSLGVGVDELNLHAAAEAQIIAARPTRSSSLISPSLMPIIPPSPVESIHGKPFDDVVVASPVMVTKPTTESDDHEDEEEPRSFSPLNMDEPDLMPWEVSSESHHDHVEPVSVIEEDEKAVEEPIVEDEPLVSALTESPTAFVQSLPLPLPRTDDQTAPSPSLVSAVDLLNVDTSTTTDVADTSSTPSLGRSATTSGDEETEEETESDESLGSLRPANALDDLDFGFRNSILMHSRDKESDEQPPVAPRPWHSSQTSNTVLEVAPTLPPGAAHGPRPVEEIAPMAAAAEEAEDDESEIDPEDDVPIGRRHPEALKAQRDARRAARKAVKDAVPAPVAPARNPFGYKQQEMGVKKPSLSAVAAAAIEESPIAGHSLLPQTDESVRLRAKRSLSSIRNPQQPPSSSSNSPELPPFVAESVLAISDDEIPLGDIARKASVHSTRTRATSNAATTSAPLPSSSQPAASSSRPSASDVVRKASAASMKSVHRPSVKRAPPPPPIDTTSAPAPVPIAAAPAPAPPAPPVVIGSFRVYVDDLKRACSVEVTDQTTARDLVLSIGDTTPLSTKAKAHWALFETWPNFGIERPLRECEHISDAVQSWPREQGQCAFIVRSTPLARHLGPIPPPVSASMVAKPVGSFVRMELGKRGRWEKRWLALEGDGAGVLTHRKSEQAHDRVVLGTLQTWDLFAVPQTYNGELRPPKPFAMAFKSRDRLECFEHTDEAVKYLCVKTEEDRQLWLGIILEARTRLGFAHRSTVPTIRRPAPIATALRSPILGSAASPTIDQSASTFSPVAGSLLSKAHSGPLLPGLPDGRDWANMTAEQRRDAMNAATAKARNEGTTLFQLASSANPAAKR